MSAGGAAAAADPRDASPAATAAATRVRPATPDDAGALAAFAAHTFRDTYLAACRADDVHAYVRAHFDATIQAAELRDPAVTVLRAEYGGALAGYAMLRRGTTPERDAPAFAPLDTGRAPSELGARPVELARFYVDRAWHGRGVADRLMAAVRAAAAGASPLWLAVWQRNARAIAFYRKRGWTVAGTATFQMGAERQDDWVLVAGDA